jgi:hypothetical protein
MPNLDWPELAGNRMVEVAVTEASPTHDGFDEGQLAKFASRVQAQLANCADCQPCGERKPVWLNFHTELEDLMEMLGVPEACRKEVAQRLYCPCCHRSHALCEEVGYKAFWPLSGVRNGLR